MSAGRSGLPPSPVEWAAGAAAVALVASAVIGVGKALRRFGKRRAAAAQNGAAQSFSMHIRVVTIEGWISASDGR